jgi:DUF1365 family protein
MSRVDHIAGHTWHGRKGDIENAFRYSIDYVLFDAESQPTAPRLFQRNRRGLASVQDRDHGGPPDQGRGAFWVREVLAAHHLPSPARIELLAQPRVLGYVFNPVSFWLCYDAENALRTVIAEVNNTFGDRHSYLCHREDNGPITPEDHLHAGKIFHVSPFQPIAGHYEFRFDIRPDRIGIWIDFTAGNGGLIATLCGPRQALTTKSLLSAMVRRPLGARRVFGLIFWQALKLRLKGAIYRTRPEPPPIEVSR